MHAPLHTLRLRTAAPLSNSTEALIIAVVFVSTCFGSAADTGVHSTVAWPTSLDMSTLVICTSSDRYSKSVRRFVTSPERSAEVRCTRTAETYL